MSRLKEKRGVYLRAYKGGGESPAASMPAAPAPVNSEIWNDGNLIGKTTMTGGVQKQESFATPFQQQQQAFNQQYLPKIKNNLFNSDAGKTQAQQVAEANRTNAMQAFNNDTTKNNAALIQQLSSSGAFGGRHATSSTVPYMTNELAKSQNQQLANIENQYTADQQNAENNYINQQSALYNLLNNGIGTQLNTNNNNIANALSGFNAGNNFNMNNYQNQMKSWAMQQALRPQSSGMSTGDLINTGVQAAGLAAMFL